MNKIYEEFFRKLLGETDNLSTYVDSLYAGTEYTEDDLNNIFGVLEEEELITCLYADDRPYYIQITFKGKHYFDGENDNKLRIVTLIDKMDEIEELNKDGKYKLIEVEEKNHGV